MTNDQLLERKTTQEVVGAFYEVYNTLGYGFLENIYRDALELELIERGRAVRKEVLIPVWYKRTRISSQRVDLIVDERIVVELKASEVLPQSSQEQLRNYLQATSFEVGLLLHFGPKPRFFRRVHTNKPDCISRDSSFPL